MGLGKGNGKKRWWSANGCRSRRWPVWRKRAPRNSLILTPEWVRWQQFSGGSRRPGVAQSSTGSALGGPGVDGPIRAGSCLCRRPAPRAKMRRNPRQKGESYTHAGTTRAPAQGDLPGPGGRPGPRPERGPVTPAGHGALWRQRSPTPADREGGDGQPVAAALTGSWGPRPQLLHHQVEPPYTCLPVPTPPRGRPRSLADDLSRGLARRP